MSNRKSYIPLLSVLALTLLLAIHNRFIQDDAFISFRYARNLFDGNGLVFNVGERVEGYTNFLWTLLLSLSFMLRADPVYFSWALGLILFPCSIWMTYHIGKTLSLRKEVGLIAALLTGTNFTYSAYATGGLETQTQSFLFLATTLLLINIRERATFVRLILFSISTASAFLIRMDSAILIAPAFFVLFVSLSKAKQDNKISQLSVAALPALATAGMWMLWKFFYYGNVLPNTFFTKTSTQSIIPGLYYICLYIFSYGFFLIVPPTGLLLLKTKVRPNWNSGFILAVSLFWLLYIVKIGGDFMEFRLMVPITPFIFIFIGWIIFNISSRLTVRISWILLLCGISLFHSHRSRLYGVETIRGLERHVYTDGWMAAGKALKHHFNHTDVVISTTAAGAIPFYSELPAIDMLGLNDKWIARNGLITQISSRWWLGEKPGHKKKGSSELSD